MTLFVKPKYGKIIVPLRREFKTNIMVSYKHFTPLAYAASPFGGDAQRWGTYPQVMFTFFKKHANDLKGKTVIPFTTHEGSGLANCVEDVKAAFAGANVTKGFSIYGHEVQADKAAIKREQSDARINSAEREQARPKAKAKVEKWLKGLGY